MLRVLFGVLSATFSRRDPLRRETTVRWREATWPAGGVFPASSFREIFFFFFYRISQWSCFALNVRDTTIKCLWFSANTTEIQGLAKPLPLFGMKRAQIVLHVSSLYLSTRSLMWHFILRGRGQCRNYFFVVVVAVGFVFLRVRWLPPPLLVHDGCLPRQTAGSLGSLCV